MGRTRTYAQAGVVGKREMTKAIVRELRYRRRSGARLLGGIGHFTGLLDLGDRVLSVTTDSVGTKVLVADALRRYDTIGIDCVAANVNDLLCTGLEPVAFVDYLAINRHDEAMAAAIARGLNRGAREANVAIVGGEVAVMPELVNGFDFVGTAVGVGRRKDLVTGERIAPGDALIGLPSSGIHANGLTLARKVFEERGLGMRAALPGAPGRTVGDALLEPTAIYVRPVRRACARVRVHGIANITGGGVRNLPRLRERVEFALTDPPPPQPLFTAIRELGGVSDEEMYQTFNMGIGMVLAVAGADAPAALRALRPLRAAVIGEVRRGRGVSVTPHGLHYADY
jgi:phosphoribosylformylglycinamidine cyclo-ligase